jgi:Carboxypeptidase regulatory-like domain/TonB dependent receptor-like, beta-barrel
MSKRIGFLILCFLALTLLNSHTSFAQGGSSGTITGSVTDPSGASVPGAAISLQNIATNLKWQMKTGASGIYTFSSLPVGTYNLTVTAQGFTSAQVTGIKLEVNATLQQNVRLRVGQVNQSVKVSAAPPTLNTQNASVGQVISSKEVTDLPLNGRDFQQLQLLSPGTISTANFQTSSGLDGGASALTTNETMNVSNGGRPGQVLFTVGGANDSNENGRGILWRPSIDEIQEFKVQTSNMSAEFGYGSSVVNVSIKSGTNQLHGDVYDFLRNDSMDARSFFAQKIEPLKRNQFGFTLGGPMILPKVYNGKNRTFWFFAYEGLRLRQGQTFFATVPTAQMRNGDFSQLPTQLYDPATTAPDPNNPGSYIRDPFVGNIIPATRIDPVAKFFLDPSWIPLPNLPGVTGNLQGLYSVPTSSDQTTTKIDHRFSDKDSLSARWSFTHENDGSYGPYHGLDPVDPGANPKLPYSYNGVLSETHLFNPTNLLEQRFSYSRANLLFTTPNLGLSKDYDQALGIQGFGPGISDIYPSYPALSISGYSGLPQGFLLNYISNNYEYTANYTMVRGRHTFKMGETYRIWQQNLTTSGQGSGTFAFNGVYTNNPESSGNTGAAVADFFLGIPYSASRYVPPGWYYQRIRNEWAYFNDDWKVTPKLTMTLGVRYEINWPTTEKYGHFASFDPSARGGQGAILVPNQQSVQIPNPITSVPLSWPFYQQFSVFASAVGISPTYLRKVAYNHFVPRIGLAYRITNDTVVRAGYGIFNVQLDGNRESEFESPPFLVRESGILNDPVIPTKTIQTFLPAGSSFSQFATLFAHDPNATTFGYSQEWNFSVQHEFPWHLSSDIAYVGTKGTNLQSARGINVPLPGPGVVQARRPYPDFGYIQWNEQSASSIYHSLQMKFERRFYRGLSLLGAFTWAKSIDYDSTDAQGYYDPYNPSMNRGVSSFDVPLNFTFAAVYSLPGLPNASAFERGILGGWSLAPIITLHSGFPYTPGAFGDPSNTGTGTRADVVAGCDPNISNPTAQKWFNTSCFVAPPGPPVYRRGDAGRNILRADAYKDLDLGIYKEFPLFSEQRRLQVRFESFNTFNQHSFTIPDATVNDPGYGRVFGASPGRILQVAAKLIF